MSALAISERTAAQNVRAFRVLSAAVLALLVSGALFADSFEQFGAYAIVVAAATLPSVSWVRMGALGIPVFPAVSLAYIPYFGFPMLRGGDFMDNYTEGAILRAALTVALFLATAMIAWRITSQLRLPKFTFSVMRGDTTQVTRLMILGIAMGVIFHAGIIWGWQEYLGTFYGVLRSVVVSFVTIACFLAGVARAQGVLRGPSWQFIISAVALIVAMAWGSLFLVGGLIYALSMLFGYVIVARRIPWIVVAPLLVTVAVLHAGKSEMRAKYWAPDTNYGGITSVTQLPGLAAEWVGEGMKAIATGEVEQDALARASLLEMLLRVQNMTPDAVDYLDGETYAMLPSILVPRFIDADKPASQAAMVLLNYRYGIQSLEESSVTAIGWGLVPEAYANFGYLGVVGMAIVVGCFCGLLAVWSARADVVSLPTLFSIAAMMVVINVEIDFIQVVSTLMQVLISVLILSALYRWLTHRQVTQTKPA